MKPPAACKLKGPTSLSLPIIALAESALSRCASPAARGSSVACAAAQVYQAMMQLPFRCWPAMIPLIDPVSVKTMQAVANHKVGI